MVNGAKGHLLLGLVLLLIGGSCLATELEVWNRGAWRDVKTELSAELGGQPVYTWYEGERFFVREKVLALVNTAHQGDVDTLLNDSGGVVASSEIVLSWPEKSLYLIHLKRGINPFQQARELMTLPAVEYAQPDILQWPQYGGEHFAYGKPDAIISDLAAWKETLGEGVRIAVIDDGVDLSHDQLTDVKAVGHQPELLDAAGAGDADHGTLVAGILFARHDGEGPNGLVPEAELVVTRLGQGWTSEVVRAFASSFGSGADVINCSWTVPVAVSPVVDLIEHIRRAGRDGKGTLVIMAAGNARKVVRPPALSATDAVVTVGAYIPDKHELRSGHGPAIDLVGPHRLLSTNTAGPDYQFFGASSAAAAYVTGSVALMLAKSPCLTADRLVARLAETSEAVVVSNQEYRVVDVDRAVSRVEPCDAPAGTSGRMRYVDAGP